MSVPLIFWMIDSDLRVEGPAFIFDIPALLRHGWAFKYPDDYLAFERLHGR